MIEKEQALLSAAAAKHDCDWRQLLAWKVSPAMVVIILPSGQKIKYSPNELADSAAAEQVSLPAAKPESMPAVKPESLPAAKPKVEAALPQPELEASPAPQAKAKSTATRTSATRKRTTRAKK